MQDKTLAGMAIVLIYCRGRRRRGKEEAEEEDKRALIALARKRKRRGGGKEITDLKMEEEEREGSFI